MKRHKTSAASDSTPHLDQFSVELEVFQGPFDLLLQLIARRELDITEVALAEVTDEFIAHMQRVPDLSSATEFLVVAATLLDMKAADLLPQVEGTTTAIDEDLSARDLLFSRLMQYRAYRAVAERIGTELERSAGRIARSVALEAHFAALLPELIWKTSAEELAELASLSLTERARPDQAAHVARPAASLSEELQIIVERLKSHPKTTFSTLVSDAGSTAVIVTRFLALLELYRRGAVQFDQTVPLGTLQVRWVATSDDASANLIPPDEADEYDD